MARKPKVKPEMLGNISEPAATTSPQKTIGRPSAFRPEMVDDIHRLALLGMINDQIAEYLEIGVATFDRWIASKPEVKEALYSGRSRANGKVANALYRRAIGYDYVETMTEKGSDGHKTRTTTKHIPGDVTAQFLWLKNRCPELWKETPEEHIDEKPVTRVEIAVVGAKVKADGEE